MAKNFFKIFLFFIALSTSNLWAENYCKISNEIEKKILSQIDNSDIDLLKNYPSCYRSNRKLILKLAFIKPEQFKYASSDLRDDELFINRVLKVHPEILKYASKKLRSNIRFMQNATYIQRDSLQYATMNLKDNKNFMTKMITIDSRNYLFASERLKSDKNIAEIAFSDNGLLIKEAPLNIRSDVAMAKIALKSNSGAIDFLSTKIKNNAELLKLSSNKSSIISKDALRDYIIENYTETATQKGLAINIVNQGKFFKDNILAKRDFITKWRRVKKSKSDFEDKLSLIEVTSRNFPLLWQKDFDNYPLLRDKVIKFFKKHNIDDSTINNLKTTFFWKIKDDLPTVAFNLYAIRSSKDSAIGPDFSDITSITVIAQKQGLRWNMSVIEVIFSSEVKTNIAYRNGHKKYKLWDLYKVNENDKSPKIIFKVEDKFREYFEIYEEQSGGKYHKVQTYKMY